MAYKRIAQLNEIVEASPRAYIPLDNLNSTVSHKISVENFLADYVEDAPAGESFGKNYYVRHNGEWVAVDLSNIQGFALDNIVQCETYDDLDKLDKSNKRLYIVKSEQLSYFWDDENEVFVPIAMEVSDSMATFGIIKNEVTGILYVTNNQYGTDFISPFNDGLKIATLYSVDNKITEDLANKGLSLTPITDRANVEAGDTLPTVLGKVQKMYTDLTNCTGFKVFGTAAGTVAEGNHTHGTNKIDALTGYKGDTSYTALTTADSLNSALSKLDNGITQINNGTKVVPNASYAALAGNGYEFLNHSKSGRVHNLTSLYGAEKTGVDTLFISYFRAGVSVNDTFTLDGENITCYCSGYTPWQGCIKSGDMVIGWLNRSTKTMWCFIQPNYWYSDSAPVDGGLFWVDGNAIPHIYSPSTGWVACGAVYK